MGNWVNFTNFITIGDETFSNGVTKEISYKDIDDKLIQDILCDSKIKTIQIRKQLPNDAFEVIDRLLGLRPDITFRIWNLMGDNVFDLDVLRCMKNLTMLRLDGHLVNHPDVIETEKLCKLTKLKKLSLNLFDLKDYSFVKELPADLEGFFLMADTMQGSPLFDCRWLLEYPRLKEVWLGKKAKKHMDCIAELPDLRKLSIRGIKINTFDFLKNTDLEALSVLWCSIGNFDSIKVLDKLRYLELWRIPRLDDISAINQLKMLEQLKLQDLSHITIMPDICNLKNLKEIRLINTPVDQTTIPHGIKVSDRA